MRHRFETRRVLVVVLVVIMLGVNVGSVAADAGVTAIPAPAWSMACVADYDQITVYAYMENDATYAKVYRALTPNGTKSYIGSANYPYYWSGYFMGYIYVDNDVDTLQTYYYWAKACNSSGCSAMSTSYSACQLNTYAAPSNVQASDGTYSSYVRVTYNLVTGASKYSIYRSTSSSGTYSFVGNDWDGSYDDTSAEPGVLRYYKVRSCTSSDNCGPYSNYNSGHRKIAAPAYVQASNGNWNGYVPVDWPNVDHATSYTLYRGTNTHGYEKSWIGLTQSSYDDYTVDGTTHYYYWVEACNSLSCSGLKGPDEGWAGEPPAAPTNVQASDGNTLMVRVTWNSSSGASIYDVYRANTQYGTYTKKNTEGITGTQWDDFSATSGVTYWYKVKACNYVGCSGYSAPDSGKRVGPPAPPTNVQAADGTSIARVRVSWSPSEGALGYQVYRNTVNNTSTATQLTSYTTDTYYDDFPPLAGPGHKYYYWVTASSSAGWSAYSEYDTGYRAEEYTATPTASFTPKATQTAMESPTPSLTPTANPTGTTSASATPTSSPGTNPTHTPTVGASATVTATPSFYLCMPLLIK